MRRSLFILVALGLAWLAGQQAALARWRSVDSLTVPQMWRSDVGVQLRASDRLATAPARFAAEAPAIAEAARAVLRVAPLDGLALLQLALATDLAQPGSGRDLARLAEAVSRRDLATEIYAADATTSSDRPQAALPHFHHALAVYPLAKQQLLPILASQLVEPEVRQGLVAYANHAWLRDFVVNAVDYDVTPDGLTAFYRDLSGRVPQADLRAGTVRMIRWLASNGQYARLAAYSRTVPGLSPDAFAAFAVNATTGDAAYAPLSWTFANSAQSVAEADGAGMQVRLAAGFAGVAASRMTVLAPGRYTFQHRAARLEDAAPAELEWHVMCPLNPLQNLLAPHSADASGLQHAGLVVPQDCTAQFWELRVSARDAQDASGMRLADLALVGP